MSPQPRTVATGEGLPVAVMGSGRWGSNLVRVLERLPEVELRWVVDPDPAARRRAAELSPGARIGAEIEPALAEVEAVVVCTPAVDHVRHARRLLERGKHVLLEKPMATTGAEAAELAELAQRSGLVLMIGHQLLYHPLFARLEELVREGAVGPVRRISAVRTGPIDLEREPGALWAFGPHDVAMIMALTGSSPLDSEAQGLLHREHRLPVAADLGLEFESGVVAEVALRRDPREKIRRLTVVGDAGELAFDDSVSGGVLYRTGEAPYVDELATIGAAQEPLLLECRHFVESVVEGRRPRTDGRHGVAVTDVLETASRNLARVDYLSPPSSSFMNSSKNTRCLRKSTANKALT